MPVRTSADAGTGGGVADEKSAAAGPRGGRLAEGEPDCDDVTLSAAAAIVATRPRKTVTSPLPSGCSRLERKMTYDRDAGSIQSDVPVNPVCPNEPIGKRSPRLAE